MDRGNSTGCRNHIDRRADFIFGLQVRKTVFTFELLAPDLDHVKVWDRRRSVEYPFLPGV